MVRQLLENARENRIAADDLVNLCGGSIVGLSQAVAVCLAEGWLVEVFVDEGLEGYELTSKGVEVLERVEREDE